MVFIGSRKDLTLVSETFKNVWITLIREFNHSFPKRNVLAVDLQEKIKSLQGRIIILKKEVTRKIEEVHEEELLREYAHHLSSLIVSLDELSQEFDEVDKVLLGQGERVDYKYVEYALTVAIIKIREIKALINIVAKSWVDPKRRSFLIKSAAVTAKGVIALLISGSGITASLHYGLTYLAKDLPRKRDGLAILISYNTTWFGDAWLKRNADVFIPTYVARVELAFGQKADIVKKAATSFDLFECLKNDSIQSIVLFGHGANNVWIATDGMVTSYGTNIYVDTNIRKRGFLVRHTCGEPQKTKPVSVFKIKKSDWKKLQMLAKTFSDDVPGCEVNLTLNKITSEGEWLIGNLQTIISSTKGGWIGSWNSSTDPKGNRLESLELNLIYVKAEYPNHPKGIAALEELIKMLQEVVKEMSIMIKMDELLPLGLPYFKKENIKGWFRTAAPWDFMIDVFGQKNKKEDKLYVMK